MWAGASGEPAARAMPCHTPRVALLTEGLLQLGKPRVEKEHLRSGEGGSGEGGGSDGRDNRDAPPAGHHNLQIQIETVKPQARWAFHAVGVELGSGSSAQAAGQVHGKVGQGGP